MLLVLTSLLLLVLVNVGVEFFLLYHANLLLPDGLGSLLEFGIDLLELVTVGCQSALAWIEWIYPFELVSRYVLVNQIIIEPNSLAVLLDGHPFYISVLHLHLLFLLQNNFHLPPLLHAELQYAQSVHYQVVFDLVVDICVSSKTRHVVHLEHPRF